MAENTALNLSTIPEMNDLDLSFILSQLSSVSGEITDRALEELLRDTDLDENPTKLDKDRHDRQGVAEPLQPATTVNMFQNAIDSLSEITNKVQEKLQNETDKNISRRNFLGAANNKARKPNVQASSRSSVVKVSLQKGREDARTCRSAVNIGVVRSKVDTRWTMKPEVRPQTADKTLLGRNALRQSSISAAVKLYGKNRVAERKPVRTKEIFSTARKTDTTSVQTNQDNSKRYTGGQIRKDGVNILRGNPALTGTVAVKSSSSSVQFGSGKDVLRELWAENNRLNQQIKSIQERLAKQNAPTAVPSSSSPKKKTLSLTAAAAGKVVANSNGSQTFRQVGSTLQLQEQWKQFESKISDITNNYEEKLDDLTRKCGALENFQQNTFEKLNTKIVTKLVDSSVQTSFSAPALPEPAQDLAVVAADRDSNTGSGDANAGLGDMNAGRGDEKTGSRDVNAGGGIVNVGRGDRNTVPPGSFALDDLVQEEPVFVPWENKENDVVPEKLPKLKFHTKVKDQKNGAATYRFNKNLHHGEEKRLLAVIRRLNSDMEQLRKENQRLKSQQASASAKMRTERRGKITRTFSTQTEPPEPSVFNSSMTKVSRILADENKSLKDKVGILEEEIEILKEKRLLDLQLLQEKHEEEVEVLLEEKLNLSKKLDAVNNWRLW